MADKSDDFGRSGAFYIPMAVIIGGIVLALIGAVLSV